MKKLIVTAVVLLFLCATACHDDLNVLQVSRFTSLSMWTSEGDARGAMQGVYTQLRSTLATNLQSYGDYRSGLYGGGMMSDKNYDNMAANNIDRGNEGTNWQSFYTTINNCNLILKHVPSIAFSDEASKNTILANAYFVRAYCYFHIARIWGDAPVLTSGFESDSQSDLFPSREPAAKVFAQVEADLEEAGKLMPASVRALKTASPGAINMLKADYYLWKAKKLNGGNDALQAAQRAVNAVLAGGYVLAGNFQQIFGIANENNPEIIFSFDFTRNEAVGGYPSMFLAPEQYLEDKSLANNPIPIGSHQQYISITDDYEDFLTSVPSDTRIPVSFGIYQEATIRWRWINKFVGEWTSNTRYFSSDLIIYRLSEAYLFKAEIENALGNRAAAISALNTIAGRAYGTPDYYPSTLDKAEIDRYIVDETLKEFVAEAKSWWTMVRFGVAFERIASLKGRENETNILLWPVHSNCINTNPNIKQTEGYN